MSKFIWHSLKVKEVEKACKVDKTKGLSQKEAQKRLISFGRNELAAGQPLSSFTIFLEQFKSPLIYILLIAGILSLILKEFTDSIVVFGAVLLNALVGFVQENKASETLKRLRETVRYEAEVMRDGNLKIVASEELVPGDVAVLNPGDKVPADGRIFENSSLKINEMALTGEWLPSNKKIELLTPATPLADRDDMVYMGTVVEDGKGRIIVTATGENTEIGKISKMIKESKEEKTPYQKKLSNLSSLIGVVVAVISFIVFLEGVATGGDFKEMFITAVAVAVAAIPEGLSVAMTVILALGMQRILKEGGLVRKLSSAETLGSTSVICTDKTGTLTEGRMKVSEIISSEEMSGKPMKKYDDFTLKVSVLTSEAFVENQKNKEGDWVVRGRSTDKALLEEGLRRGMYELYNKAEKVVELPFTTVNKFVGAVVKEKTNYIFYLCGAPERIINKCAYIKRGKRKIKISESILRKIEEKLEGLTDQGLRVVASAFKKVKISSAEEGLQSEIQDLIFAGFITINDPVREEVKEAIEVCKKAGMRPIIATGDHKLTARAVGKELGFDVQEENILEGRKLETMSARDFDQILEKVQIYARVEPKHKTRIIQAWQDRGEVVAMTGDGINDAPALKKADIGVALGSGTEVAKETSDLILLNDSFSIIIKAVEEGRAILDNIRKVITYLLSDSFTEVILVGFSILAGVPLPILAVQILWVNMIEDGLPGIALAFEPKEKDLMSCKPTGHKVPLLSREMKVIIFIIGILTDFILLGIFFWLLHNDRNIAHIRTMIFAALSVDSLFYAFSCKSLRQNLWHINPFSNRFLIIALMMGMLTLGLAIYVPILQTLLKTVPLTLKDWGLILGLGVVEVILIEITKWHFIAKKEFV